MGVSVRTGPSSLREKRKRQRENKVHIFPADLGGEWEVMGGEGKMATVRRSKGGCMGLTQYGLD
jgi:hypothetical protein